MIRKLMISCAAISMLTMQLPACSFTASVESLLSPPRLTAEQEQIYQALQKTAAGSQIGLKYPKSGERLSAFIVEDLDGDQSDEAIVFYTAGRNTAEENPLRICLLDQTDGGWQAIDEYPAAGAEIDRVDIAQLGTNPRKNLVISYSMVDGAEHAAGIYHYDHEKRTLERSLLVQYSAMALRDLDENGTLDLFFASAAKAPQPAAAAVYSLDSSGKYPQPSKINLPDTFTDIARLAYGSLPTGKGQNSLPVVYMDGTTGATNVQTVVLTYQEEKLRLIYADSADGGPNTKRAGGFQTMDIDGDGEQEIPANKAFYGYEKVPEASPLSLTNWYVCRNGLLIQEHASFYSVQEGYVFLIPQRWERRVTAMPENNEIVFYEYDPDAESESGVPKLREPLLRLAAVTDPIAADAMQTEGYILLRQKNGRYYLGKPEPGSRTLSLTGSELMTAMRFLP